MKAPFTWGRCKAHEASQIGSVQSGNKNVARIRHDRTLEVALGLWGCHGQKERGQLRFCCDFCYLNAVTIKDAYPIPRIDESLSKLGDAKFFTTRVTKKYGNLGMCYVDDVVIATTNLADHIDRLDEVFGYMKRAGLKCKPSKCKILRDSIKYLGRIVDRHGVRSDPEAVEAVLTWKAPRTDTQLMSFLGFANYFRELIKGYADKVYPMQKLMRNN